MIGWTEEINQLNNRIAQLEQQAALDSLRHIHDVAQIATLTASLTVLRSALQDLIRLVDASGGVDLTLHAKAAIDRAQEDQ